MVKHFIEWIERSRIDENNYYITSSHSELVKPSKIINNLKFINIDPTSYLRVKDIMTEVEFSTVFLLMREKEEAIYSLKNIRMVDPKLFVILVSQWEDLDIDDEYVDVIKMNDVLASALYEKLPNVPIIAKNIGLGKGEIMEILVPFGSSFAYRHVGAIAHRKWRVVAIYRQEKQIFPNNSTMILPNDKLIVIGNSFVLEEIYKRINKRQGLFPEPFGKNLYLLINMEQKEEDTLLQINEAIFLSNQLPKTKLYIRIFNVGNVKILNELRAFETKHISLYISYLKRDLFYEIDYDLSRLDIGLFLMENSEFFKRENKSYFYNLMRPIYIFGDKSLYNIKASMVLMGERGEMEAISTSAFDFSESLGLSFSLCNYNPEGDFDESRTVVEHYESLSRLYNFKIKIDNKRVNPIRELLKYDEVLHIAPLIKKENSRFFINFFSTKISDYLISIKKHPQLLIPVDK